MSPARAVFLLFVGAGYVVAVSAAVIVTVGLILTSEILQRMAGGSALSLLRDLPAMLAVGFAWTFSCALLGFVVAIVLGERRRWDRWHRYALAGLVNAAPSLAIFGLVFGSPFDAPPMVVASFPGGFAGGAAYWFSAGRLVARWRPTAPMPSGS